MTSLPARRTDPTFALPTLPKDVNLSGKGGVFTDGKAQNAKMSGKGGIFTDGKAKNRDISGKRHVFTDKWI